MKTQPQALEFGLPKVGYQHLHISSLQKPIYQLHITTSTDQQISH